jgi:hypothetical protein
MKKYILIFLLSLGLFGFAAGQAKADEDFSVGPVTLSSSFAGMVS